jgi:hypothetical protein
VGIGVPNDVGLSDSAPRSANCPPMTVGISETTDNPQTGHLP